MANFVVYENEVSKVTAALKNENRIALFVCSELRVGDKAYFYDLLDNHLNKPEVARAFYEFLIGRDLSSFNSQPPPMD